MLYMPAIPSTVGYRVSESNRSRCRQVYRHSRRLAKAVTGRQIICANTQRFRDARRGARKGLILPPFHQPRDSSFLSGNRQHLARRDVLGYREHPRFHLLAVERQNRGLGAFRRRHGDDGETPLPAASALHRDIDLGDIAVRGKQALQVPLGCGGARFPTCNLVFTMS